MPPATYDMTTQIKSMEDLVVKVLIGSKEGEKKKSLKKVCDENGIIYWLAYRFVKLYKKGHSVTDPRQQVLSIDKFLELAESAGIVKARR